MKKIEAIIFDMDGVLIDSEPFWRRAEIEVFKTVGINLAEEDCCKTAGFRFDEVVQYWYRQHAWKNKSFEAVEQEVIDKMKAYILHDVPVMQGVQAGLKLAHTLGLKTAIASSSPLELIATAAQKLGDKYSFQALVSAEFETYGKPHPAVFISAARTLDVLPEKCLVIEDSLNGVIAAKAAKMWCAAIPAPQDWTNSKFEIADFKFEDMTALNKWLKQFYE